jgi:hypothetical protein
MEPGARETLAVAPASEEHWMADENSPGMAVLGGIASDVKHLTAASTEHGKKLDGLNAKVHDIELKDEKAHSRIERAVMADTAALQAHEVQDDRRFKEVHKHLQAACILPAPDAPTRARKVAKATGAAGAGGALTLFILELVDLLQKASP